MSKHINLNQTSVCNNQSQSGQNNDNNISMITARNKLKQIQDKIYQTKYRLNKLNNKQIKVSNKKMYQTRLSGFRQNIRDFITTRSQIKRQYGQRRSSEVQKSHDINLQRRKHHKDKLIQMKQMLHTQNKWVYQTIRKQKQNNDNLIKRQKRIYHQQKRNRRDQMFEDEQRRLSYLRQFIKNKHITAKLSKQKQTNQIQNQISKKQKLLAYLERQTSQISVNPQSISDSKSLQHSQVINCKGFRLNSLKKQKQITQQNKNLKIF